MADSRSLGAARSTYWQVNGFGEDGGDALAWVPLKIWRFTLRIPNSEGRRRAVRIHDLHHVLTGFQTDLRGEAEIAAWELASGCLRWPAATVLNLFALAIGMLLAPRRLARAWALGRHTGNLYAEDGVDHLLPLEVSAVRARLGLDAPRPGIRLRDVLGMSVVALPVLAGMLAPIAGLAWLVSALA
jgi:hypothetical protein